MNDSPYTPLPLAGQSRLIVLEPGEYTAPLQCRFEVFNFEAAPLYEALSYTWGNAFSADILPLPHQLEEDSSEDSEDSVGRPKTRRTLPRAKFSTLSKWAPSSRRGVHDDIFPSTAEEANRKRNDGHIMVGCAKLDLQQNLEHALRHLRHQDRERTLWIDGICINQNDYVERGHQVSQMGKIFELATMVLVWLGEASHSSDSALQFVRDLWQMNLTSNNTSPHSPSEWMDFKENFASYGYFSNERLIQLRALSYLVNRQWFYRRWVVQEVAFAANITVQTGHFTVSWAKFANAISFLSSHHTKLERILRNYHPQENWAFSSMTLPASQAGSVNPDIRARVASQFLFITRSLLFNDPKNRILSCLTDMDLLITRLRLLQVTDPRDTVYALFSLARDASGSQSLYPDYSKTPCEVFVELVKHTITTQKSLDIILKPWVPHCPTSLPSWIPCGDSTREKAVLFRSDLPDQIQENEKSSCSFYAASGPSQPSFEISLTSSGHLLQAKGFFIADIAHRGAVARASLLPMSWRSRGRSKQLSDVVVGGRTLTGDRPPRSFDLTCWELFRPDSRAANDFVYGQQDSHHGWHPTISEVDISHLIDTFYGAEQTLPKSYLARITQSENILPFLERLRDCISGRRLVETSDGRLGLVPAKTRVDDKVCILMGCSLPVILRPRGDNFIVLGEAYVHGISDGEAMKGLETGQYRLQDFLLR